MKKIIMFLCTLFCCTTEAQAASKTIKEYGIVLLLPEVFADEAKKVNAEIASQIHPEANLLNVFHVTLFQGRFAESKIYNLFQELKKQNFRKVRITMDSKFEIAQDRYISWPLVKNDDLKNLHIEVVKIANPYHQGVLKRFADSYSELDKKQKEQVDNYGMSGLFDEYNPHVTLFYFPAKNSGIKNFIKDLSPQITKKVKGVDATYLAIAELGVNGNIEHVLFKIELGR
ncbi:MAG: hypothetical protein V4694_05345 [Pseudomonadota bacterium]